MTKPAQPKAPSQEIATIPAAPPSRDLIGTLESNPMIALLSGLALGAAAGALLPRSAREKALLAPLGTRVAAAAEAAIAAGRDAGTKALEENDLSVEALRTQVSTLVGQASNAANAVATAAFDAALDHATA
jgi:hypothetical protein